MPVLGIETRILELLNNWLKGLTLSPVMPIAWPNLNFTPSTGWLRPSLLPARTDAATLSFDGLNDHRGIYQVDVFWPAGRGEVDASERASLIIARFKRGTRLVQGDIQVRIDDPPWRSPALQEPGWYQIPVSIPYRAFVSNP